MLNRDRQRGYPKRFMQVCDLVVPDAQDLGVVRLGDTFLPPTANLSIASIRSSLSMIVCSATPSASVDCGPGCIGRSDLDDGRSDRVRIRSGPCWVMRSVTASSIECN